MEVEERPFKGTVMGGLLLAALGILFFAPWLSGDKIFFPKHTASYLPWRDEVSQETLEELEQAANPLMTDKVYMFQPELLLSKESFLDGRLPLWDPYTLGGIPHLAQGRPAAFELLNMGYLFLPPERAYAFTALLQTVLGAFFMLLFLRSLEIRHFAATIGALAFGFSGWMLVHLHYFMITGAALWLPLLLLGTEKLIRGARPWWIFALAFGTFQTLCAGFPQIGVMNLYMTTAYALFRGVPAFRKSYGAGSRRLALIASGVFLGLLLSAVQLLPSMEMGYSKDSTRGMATLEQIQEKKLEPLCLLTYLAPDLYGHPDLSRGTESPYFKPSSLLSFATLPQRADLNYLEMHGYVGLLPFLLALLVLVAKPRAGWRFFAGCALFCLLAALSVPGIIHLTSIAPGLMVGDVKRFIFPAAACLSILAAFTLDALWKPEGAPRVLGTGLVLIAVLIAAFGAALIGLTASSDEALMDTLTAAIHRNTGLREAQIQAAISDADFQTQREFLKGVLLKTILYLLLTGAVLAFTTKRTRDWPVSRPLIVAVLLLDLFAIGWSFNRPMPASPPLFDDTNPVVRFLKENTGSNRIIRFGDDMVYPVNAGSIHHIHDTQGYAAYYFKRYRMLLDRLEPGRSNAYGMHCLMDPASLGSPVLDVMGVKYILSSKALSHPGIRQAFQRKSVWIYENPDCLPRAFLQTRARFARDWEEAAGWVGSEGFDPAGMVVIEGKPPDWAREAPGIMKPARITAFSEQRIEAAVQGGPGWLVLSDPFAPGWIAELDGRPVQILPANLAFRAVEIPDAAPHQVTFCYRPKSIRIGGFITLGGLVLCLLLAAVIRYRE